MIKIKKINEVFVNISAESGILQEIKDKFSFKVPNSDFMKYNKKNKRLKYWNGMKSLFDLRSRNFYIGLLPELIKYFEKYNYEYEISGDFDSVEFSEYDALEFIKSLNLPERFKVRDYQLKYFIKAVRERRLICLSPTGSGKSLLCYLLYRYFNKKTLLVVPSINLILQMQNDFKEYGYDIDNIHTIYEGRSRHTARQLILSTWQSIYLQDEDFFKDVTVVIGDEAHGFSSSSLVKLMEKLSNADVRVGLTGTLSGEALQDTTVEGLFGPSTKYISTKQMIDQGYSSNFLIKGIVLNHVDSPFKNLNVPVEYRTELDYLLCSKKRNNFVKKLALSLHGNTFVMFRFIDHGQELYRLIKESADCPVFYVDGSLTAEERESIRQQIEKLEKSITIASTVFATGVNITSINDIIFSQPSKRRIKLLQSIGRGLRKHENKKLLTLFDVADQIQDNAKNITLRQFGERLKIYNSEEFDKKLYRIKL